MGMSLPVSKVWWSASFDHDSGRAIPRIQGKEEPCATNDGKMTTVGYLQWWHNLIEDASRGGGSDDLENFLNWNLGETLLSTGRSARRRSESPDLGRCRFL